MPRIGRLHIPGGHYHVIGRGLERRRIFEKEVDKQDFLTRLGEGLERTQSQCLAWAIMSNHYHLLIRVKTQPLSELMSGVLSGYATQYNLRNRRAGYVFQNRFKSILCDADNYLLELVRYIHLNPLKAGIVKSFPELDDYSWTGHAELMGKPRHHWFDAREVLSLFGTQLTPARKQYQLFVQEGNQKLNEVDFSGGGLVRSYGGWEKVSYLRREHEARIGDERILGSSEFVERVLKEDELRLDEKSKWKKQGWNLQKLCNQIGRYFNVDQTDLRRKGRSNKISDAKGLVCYWGPHILGIPTSEIAKYLGISQSGVTKASKRGVEYCNKKGIKFDNIAKN